MSEHPTAAWKVVDQGDQEVAKLARSFGHHRSTTESSGDFRYKAGAIDLSPRGPRLKLPEDV
jgi:hypothetical protein